MINEEICMTKRTDETTFFKVAVHCPMCHRKLMTVRRTRNGIPCVAVIDAAKPAAYGAETRCPGCHSYIGIAI